uniref:Pyrin domain-containing protein n=1 Tax=Astatotilapia calliptera TaxID=8154 RepID=A0A3P8PIB2_ASTCA
MTTPKEILLGTLKDLGRDDFEEFKWHLKNGSVEGLPAIPESELENAERTDIVDLMFDTYSINTFEVAKNLLGRINRNDLLENLNKTIPEPTAFWEIPLQPSAGNAPITMLPFGSIIRKHSIHLHCYADDTQLYLSMKSDNTHQLVKLQECLKDIKTWMAANFLLLNSDQTEVIVLGPENLRNMVSKQILTLDGITLASSNAVRNLGVIFDQDMSFNAHIKQICKTAFFHLCNISKVRNILSQSDAEKLVHAFITSRLDYCNLLLSGCPKNSLKSLQLIQNAAARVLTGTRKREHISPVLASLHWLPVKSRIEFKILLLTYKVLNNQAPSYLNDLVVPYHPIRALRSRSAGLLVVHRVFKSRMGGRAFSFQAPKR